MSWPPNQCYSYPYSTPWPVYPSPLKNSLHSTTTSIWSSDMSAFISRLREEATALLCQKHPLSTLPIDRKCMTQGIRLVLMAADEYDQGNEALGLEIYLSGIEKIVMAFSDPDEKTKLALKERLSSVQGRLGILCLANVSAKEPPVSSSSHPSPSSFSMLTHFLKTWKMVMDSSLMQPESHQEQEPSPDTTAEPLGRFKRFRQKVIRASMTCAVFVKQSPLPDFLFLLLNTVIHYFLQFNDKYHIYQKMEQFCFGCGKALLKMDEQYHLHEYASETLYMVAAASFKAVVAYREAPTYSQVIRLSS
ncbi:hypothetical protein BDF14DRAFT_1813621 [Spinellus fusiger]|nr:hypothetical protein BDF14DRAFT_1813621 [Spinellus fusiger]